MAKKTIKLWCAACAQVREFTVGVDTPGSHNVCSVCRTHYERCNGCGHG